MIIKGTLGASLLAKVTIWEQSITFPPQSPTALACRQQLLDGILRRCACRRCRHSCMLVGLAAPVGDRAGARKTELSAEQLKSVGSGNLFTTAAYQTQIPNYRLVYFWKWGHCYGGFEWIEILAGVTRIHRLTAPSLETLTPAPSAVLRNVQHGDHPFRLFERVNFKYTYLQRVVLMLPREKRWRLQTRPI